MYCAKRKAPPILTELFNKTELSIKLTEPFVRKEGRIY